MPIPEDVPTKYIIENLENRVKKYNSRYVDYIEDYQQYIKQRMKFISQYNKISELIHDTNYIDELRKILIRFGMNARNSQLVTKDVFHNTLIKVSDSFKEIENKDYSIEKLEYSDKLFEIINNIYDELSSRESLTSSGGFVIASKTMHFLMPELFIMIDGAHIGISLYNVDDYLPHPSDGNRWREIFPNYQGRTPNPSPRGAGRKSWDSEKYCMALFFYKRLFYDWIQYYNSNKNGFMKIDEYSNLITRIIDKGLW